MCHCNVVSDRTIRAAIADGAADVDAVGARCGAGDACGGCVPTIEALLAEAAAAIRTPELVGLRQAARRRLAGHTSFSPGPALARPAAG
ncbi:bacterioferritin-associated ferredoxin [Egicoccus sp. AB-alg6-2]|uniref:(2Fe-2S)-binding protein n=1 Tax=Egicoccus sp. AB-alg6-2 TaxID=3242692 RepID=UPI00359CF2CB